MTLTLTPVKKQKILVLCDEILSSPHIKIRKVSQLLGKFSSSVIAVPQGKLNYMSLEVNKTCALKINKGNFDKFMILSKRQIYTGRKAILWIPLHEFLDLTHLLY